MEEGELGAEAVVAVAFVDEGRAAARLEPLE